MVAFAKTMRAVVYRGVNDLRLEEVPVPRPNANELLVKVAVCGVCPTDIKKIQYATVPPPRIFGREIFTSILIRDPIARIRSIYAFERSQGTCNPGAVKARELSFRGYVEWRLQTSPTMLCNFQVGFCSRGSANFGSPGPAQLKEAIANLDSMSIVGTVARFEEWLALAQKTLSTGGQQQQ